MITQMTPELKNLPIDWIQEIVFFLEISEFTNISVVRKEWSEIFTKNWFWKEIFERDFKEFYTLEKTEDEVEFKTLCKSICSLVGVRPKNISSKEHRNMILKKVSKLGGRLSIMNSLQYRGCSKVRNYKKDTIFETCYMCESPNTVLIYQHTEDVPQGSYGKQLVVKCLYCHTNMVIDLDNFDQLLERVRNMK